jgi:hypothetical protein
MARIIGIEEAVHVGAQVGRLLGRRIDRAATRQIGAGAKAPARAGQQHGADGPVVPGAGKRAVHRLDQRIVHGVQPPRAIEREGQNAGVEGGQDRCFLHTGRLA